jgi:hypothetical protein
MLIESEVYRAKLNLLCSASHVRDLYLSGKSTLQASSPAIELGELQKITSYCEVVVVVRFSTVELPPFELPVVRSCSIVLFAPSGLSTEVDEVEVALPVTGSLLLYV